MYGLTLPFDGPSNSSFQFDTPLSTISGLSCPNCTMACLPLSELPKPPQVPLHTTAALRGSERPVKEPLWIWSPRCSYGLLNTSPMSTELQLRIVHCGRCKKMSHDCLWKHAGICKVTNVWVMLQIAYLQATPGTIIYISLYAYMCVLPAAVLVYTYEHLVREIWHARTCGILFSTYVI